MIALEAVSKSYGGQDILREASWRIGRGERIGLVGPNGAGKTTLFHCVTGTLQPSSGSVKLFDTDVTYLPEHQRTKLGIGRTFQITNVFTDLSPVENLALAIVGTDRRKWICGRPLGAFPDIRAQALARLDAVGLKDDPDKPVKLLSYGERRQLELAMAIASRPKLLLLDEPLAGMGGDESRLMVELVRDLKRTHTILLVEHDIQAVFSIADRITVLVSGRTVVTGTPEQVRTNAGVREAYLGEE